MTQVLDDSSSETASLAAVDFNSFVAARWSSLVRYGLLLTGDEGRGQDLAQAALAKAWVRWPRVAADNPEAYVRQTILHDAISAGRRRWKAEQSFAVLPEPASTALETDPVDDRDVLVRALAGLPARQRAVIVLRYAEDRSELETAQLLGISTGTVKSQASRGLALLRRFLDDDSRSGQGHDAD